MIQKFKKREHLATLSFNIASLNRLKWSDAKLGHTYREGLVYAQWVYGDKKGRSPDWH